ncbi:MAG: PKD domain-containing protein [Bacteroidetes bacterium]|nr:MAG: PKD domain-containing protein [Bacteroidota bacterium]
MKYAYNNLKRVVFAGMFVGLLMSTAQAQFNNDMRTTNVALQGGTCGLTSDSIQVTINNFGLNAQSNITVKAEVTGTLGGGAYSTTLSTVYAGTLTSGASASVMLGGINTAQGGNIDIYAYTELVGEEDVSNDTTLLIGTVYTGTPADPTTSNVSACGDQSVQLTAGNVTGQDSVLWYNSMASTSPIAIGTNFTTPVLPPGTHTYYATAGRGFAKGSRSTTYAAGNGQAGNMFDITALTTITIDSFALNMLAGNDSAAVFWRSGTYVGNENSSTGWNFLGGARVSGQGQGSQTSLPVGGLTINQGQKVGIYIFLISTTNIRYTNGANTYTNSDIRIDAGVGKGPNWNSTFNPRTWNGTVFYTLPPVCQSNKVPVDVVINPLPTGAELVAGANFDGTYSLGNSLFPDIVATGDLLEYELNPPTGYTNAGFGTDWNVTKLDILTANGTAIPSGDTSTVAPGSGNGILNYTPSAGWSDSTIVISVGFIDVNTGCESSMDRTLFVAPRPDPSFSVGSVCQAAEALFDNTSVISSGSMTYKWYFGDGDSSTDGKPKHAYAMSGSYLVTLEATSNYGYMVSDTQTIVVYELPEAGFSVVNQCEGTALPFTDNSLLPAGTPSYTWDFGDGMSGTGNNPTHLYANPGSYNVTMEVDVNGCKDKVSRYVTQAPRAVPGFTSTFDCNNTSVSFDNTSTLSNGHAGYTWKYGDNTFATGFNPSHDYGQFGTYNVTLVAQTDLGCIDSTTSTITLLEAPDAMFTMNAPCAGDSLYFTNNSSVPAGNANVYEWIFSDGFTTASNSPIRYYGGPGSHWVSLKVSSSNGCLDSTGMAYTVNEKPQAGMIVSDVCEGEATNFQNGSVSGSPMTYTWDFGNGSTSNAKDTSFALATGTYNVSLTTMLSNGCSDVATQTVNVNPLPPANFTYNSTYNMNGGMIFLGPTNAGLRYRWFFGDGAYDSVVDPTHNYILDGSFDVTLIVTSDKGCVNTSKQTIYINRTSVEGVDAQAWNVYPNPSTGKFTVTWSSELNVKSVQVVNALGQALPVAPQVQLGTKLMDVDASALTPGVYFLNILDNAGTLSRVKFVIQ